MPATAPAADKPPTRGLRLTQYTESTSVPRKQLKACYKLVENIKHMYRASGMGWSSSRKHKEFGLPGMVFLVITDSGDKYQDGEKEEKEEGTPVDEDDKVAAFASVLARTPEDYDSSNDEDEDPTSVADASLYVSYLYELHVDPRYQGRGLAKQLLDAAKNVARAQPHPRAVSKLLLNVFNMNVPAQNFYLWNGFEYNDHADMVDLPPGFVTAAAQQPPPPPPRASTPQAARKRAQENRHKLHPRLRHTQMHRTVTGWTEMVWHKSPAANAP